MLKFFKNIPEAVYTLALFVAVYASVAILFGWLAVQLFKGI